MPEYIEVELQEDQPEPQPGVGILDKEQTDKLCAYLSEQIPLALAERQTRYDKWKKWRRQRDSEPESATAEYPWPGAANVVPPLSSVLTQNMYAFTDGTFEVRQPPCMVTAYNGKDRILAEDAKAIEDYLKMISDSPLDLNLSYQGPRIRYEGTSMGTCFIKVPWTTDTWSYQAQDAASGAMEEVRVTRHDGPEWVLVPVESLLYRSSVQSIQRAPWMDCMFNKTEAELVNLKESGEYQNVDLILKFKPTSEDQLKEEELKRIGYNSSEPGSWPFHEVYLFWKLPGKPFMVDLVVTYNLEANVLVKAEYNQLGWRPLVEVNYLFRPFFLDGKGVGWQVEHMQDEVESIHRMRLNNMHIGGMKMFAMKRNAGYKGSEKIYPGKIWKVDDPSKDFIAISSSDMYAGEIQAEMISKQYAEENVGFSSAQRGFADMIAKSGTSAQLQMFNAQQGGKLISAIAKGMVNSFSQAYMFTVFQLVRNKDRVIANEREAGRMSPEQISVLERALSMELKDVPKRLRFFVRTTEIDKTYEARRQNVLSMAQLYSMFWEKVIPMAAQVDQNWAKELMVKAFTGSSRFLEKVLQFFGEEDTERYVPEYEKFEMLLELKKAMQGQLGDLSGQRDVTPGAGAGPAETAQVPGAVASGLGGMENRQPAAARPAGGVGPIGPQ